MDALIRVQSHLDTVIFVVSNCTFKFPDSGFHKVSVLVIFS